MKLRKAFINVCVLVALMAVTLSVACADSVKITEAQKARLRQIAQEYMTKARKLHTESYGARVKMNKAYEQFRINSANTEKAIKELSKAQRSLLMLHLNNQIDLRKILTEQQFNQMIQSMPPPETPGAPAFGMRDFLNQYIRKHIGLTQQQLKNMEELWKMDNKSKNITENIGETTRKLMNLYWKYRLNVNDAKGLINDIHKNQRDLERTAYEKMQLLHSILTPEQFNKMKPFLPSSSDAAKRQSNTKKPQSQKSTPRK